MWIWFVIVFFVLAIGLTLGGVSTFMRGLPPIVVLIVLSFYFLFFSYIGMFVALVSFSWFGFRFFDIAIVICSFLFIIAMIRSYHPAFGYQLFYKPIAWILASLFFFMGLQWGTLGYGTFFTITMTFFFTLAVFIGILLYNSMLMWVKNAYLAAVIPLASFLLVTVIKLL
ncbi:MULTISPECIES: hypothetical protein [Shouchella]|uniref:Uncharacterized protein n=2 Tax=Shouchella TaxID=2893057 RepID=A0ABY7W2B1_9BACI|nr:MULTISPECIES: hypothetical protein [Shouchella]MED4127936.1 hypothetical protein [Shouchella miscanthi]WDF03082.1 hypothetical protein PQ477_16530 [Shouchella hunanensis]